MRAMGESSLVLEKKYPRGCRNRRAGIHTPGRDRMARTLRAFALAYGHYSAPWDDLIQETLAMSTSSASTAVPEELAKFEAMADSWWDPEGKFKPLHQFNPERLRFILRTAAEHFSRDLTADRPFEGLRLLDVGCGGGLLCEPLARMGFAVTGLDAAQKNITVAGLHADRMGLEIDYRCDLVEKLAERGEHFDVVLTMEVVEHVDHVDLFLAACSHIVRPGGLMFGATMNRTLKSLAMAKIGAEYILRWLPRGTHDWRKFLKPSEFAAYLRDAGLVMDQLVGMSFHPIGSSWTLSDDLSVNYLLSAHKPVIAP
jgi:2-polyprenyl-6-hydroxyphenyl methylase/3-demethylubiquinone-9 3-methyltransferase